MFVALVIAALGPAVDPEPPARKVIAWTDWHGFHQFFYHEQDRHLVIRSTPELVGAPVNPDIRDKLFATLLELITKPLGVKSIDWKKQMLVVVAGGECPTDGYSVEVVGIRMKGQTMTVSWKLRQEAGGERRVTHPVALALVPAHKGKVVFEQKK